MTVVSNASPLVALARIGQLDLIEKLYGQILIPQAVWDEVVIEGEGQPGAEEVSSADWIRTHAIANRQLAHGLSQNLGLGEAEAIVLAQEAGADLLLMDERIGRQTAKHFGLSPVGVIGVLVEAKLRGLIPAVKPLLDALRDEAGFHVGEALYLRVLQDEDEFQG